MQCGGCDYQGIPYEKQLAKKQKYIEGLLALVLLKNGYEKEEVSKKFLPILGAEVPQRYRNKVHAVFGMGKNKKTICGIYEKKSHWVVDVDDCQIEDERAVEIIRGIKDMMPSFRMRPYDEDKKSGLLRHVLIRVGEHILNDKVKKEYMVILVTGTKEFPGKKNFVKVLVEKYPEITTVVWNINQKKTSMVLGEKEEVLYGSGYVTDTLLELDFQISPKSFYQVNKRQTEKLYRCVADFAGLSKEDVVLDAYCGTGTIGMSVAKYVKKVIGVELNPAAVSDAKRNAKQNNVSNIKFLCEDAGDYLMKVASENSVEKTGVICEDRRENKYERPKVVIMDPPRSGSSKDFLNSLLKLKPQRIVYVSCGPESLKRDLEFLLRPKHGKRLYRVEKIQPVDMFPMTKHVETVVLMSRVDGK